VPDAATKAHLLLETTPSAEAPASPPSFRFALEAMWALVSPLDYGESVPLLQSVASE
jgi:hypothetical protein